jgi:precorrin-2 dehydrogenase / sirohydrochlorin ferrochelatase
MLPLMVDITERLVVVVGSGPVGRRKLRTVRLAGARVRVVSLEESPAALVSDYVEWICAPYERHHLDGAVLVFAAGPTEVNRRVVEDARALGILVNSATEPGLGDIHLPAVVRRGDLVVAIATGGSSPALAVALSAWLEAELDDSFRQWAALLGEMRVRVRDAVDNPEKRTRLLMELADWSWLEMLKKEGRDATRQRMLERLHLDAK